MLEVIDLFGKVGGHIIVRPDILAPTWPSLAIALLSPIDREHVGQRVNNRHHVVFPEVAAAILSPTVLQGSGVFRIGVKFIPPEGNQLGIVGTVHDVIVLVHPGIGAPALVIVGIAVGEIHVPHHHLEARVLAVAALEELTAQAVAVHVVGQFLGNLVVDKVLHIQVLPVIGGACGPVIPQGGLHLVDATRDVRHLFLSQVLIIGRLVLEVNILVHVTSSCGAHGMILGRVNFLIIDAVHLHDVPASEFVTLHARVRQIDAVLALRDDLGENKHAVVGAIEEKLAVTALGRIFHPRSRHLKGQQVTHHALVGIRGQ